MTDVVLLISLFAALTAMVNWRAGISVMLVVGVLQDALRKLTPGAPGYFLLWAAAIFGVVSVAAILKGAFRQSRGLTLGDKGVKLAWSAYLLMVLAQALNAWTRYGSLALATLGIVFYLAPVVALIVGLAYLRSERHLFQFLKAYVWVMLPVGLSIYLSVDYADAWPVLRDVGTFTGTELLIFDLGAVLKSHPGFMRTGEIAGWHAATVACFLIMLAHRKPTTFVKVTVAVLVLLLMGAISLTGRRKMLMLVSLFLVMQWALLGAFRQLRIKKLIPILLLGLVGSFALTLLDAPDKPAGRSGLYAQRGGTVFEDSWGRIQLAGILLQASYDRSGGIGLGAGAASQGARFVGVDSGASGAAEAGLGKIVVELGVPGALVIGLLLVALTRRLLQALGILAKVDPPRLYYAASFVAILVANMVSFTVSSLVYGDSFVLIMLGLIAGFVFALCNAGIAASRQGVASKQAGGEFRRPAMHPVRR